MTGATPLTPEPDGAAVRLAVRLQPGARRPGLAGLHGGALKLAVNAPPENGRANAAATELLAELFGLRTSSVTLVRGHSARSKVFRLALPFDDARARLAVLLERCDPSR